MTIIETMAPFVGTWHGHNRMRIMPTDEFQESVATATVSVTAREFVTIEYTWSYEDKPQSGLLLLGSGAASGTGAAAVWVDSFHSGPEWMNFAGEIGDDGVVRLTGWYAAPSGPDWGWEIHIEPGDGNSGRITMNNLVPGHDPYQVVEAVYRRQA